MGEDLKHAWRALRGRPGATIVAVLCLALGVGANATLFGVVDALHYRPPSGVAAPSELLRLTLGDEAMASLGAGRSVTWPAFEEARDRLAEVAEVAAYAPRQLTLGAGEDAAPLAGVIVTARYFDVLGVRPYAGRLFDERLHDVPGAEPVAVLSHRAWRGRFGGDPEMIGGRIELNGVPVTIIGIAAAGFDGVDLGEPEAWLPVGVTALDQFGGARQFTERVMWLQMVARQAANATPAAVQHVAAGLNHDRYAGPAPPALHAEPLRPMFFAEQQGRNPVPAWAIGITLAVLLLACATVANLLLAQGVTREREVAVRLALGAPRSRVVRQLLIESVLIALAAAAAATLLAAWSGGLLRSLPIPVIPQLVDARVTVYAFVVALLTTALFGLAPAVRLSNCSLETVLRRGRVWSGSARLQHALMTTQIALSFVLLVGAGLFAGSLHNARQIDTGFDLRRLLEVSVPHGAAAPSARSEFVEQALERLAGVPGVEAVTAGGIVPFGFLSRSSFHIPDGRAEDEQPLPVLVNAVGPDYLRTMGLRTVAGRPFGADDIAGTAPVAMVSEALARLQWRDRSPVGACIRLSRRHGDDCVLIAGVVGDARVSNLHGEPDAMLYLVASQDPRGGMPATIFVRAADNSGGLDALARRVRGAVRSLDNGAPYIHVQPLDERARPQRIEWEVAATLFAGFSALATLLAAIGLFMVVAFAVAQRKREIGVRMSLGARRVDVVGLVLQRGAALAGIGILAGALLALAGGRLLTSRLYGVSAADPGTYVYTALLLLGVALLASGVPAAQASRVEPLSVLRED